MALYQCSWRWHPSAADHTPEEREKLFASVFRVAEAADTLGSQRLLGWYTYPGQTAGFLLLETASHEELAKLLRPYTALMTFDVMPLAKVDYDEALARLIGDRASG